MAHRDRLREQRLLNARRADVNFQQAHAGLGEVRCQIHGVAAGLQVHGRRGDLLALRGDPNAPGKRARTIDAERQREALAGKHLLRRRHAFQLHRQTRAFRRRAR